jgi:hypothetical protein
MTTTDWILDITLILVVFRQLRWSRIDAYKYLDPIPTGGNDLPVIGAFAALGTLLGVSGGLTTRVRVGSADEVGRTFVRAGFAAASLWVLGMGARLAFSVWAQHDGGPTLVRFSEQHDITSVQAWVSGLILMVLCEVGTRIGTILTRAAWARKSARDDAPAATGRGADGGRMRIGT